MPLLLAYVIAYRFGIANPQFYFFQNIFSPPQSLPFSTVLIYHYILFIPAFFFCKAQAHYTGKHHAFYTAVHPCVALLQCGAFFLLIMY